jgi:hypothetical protein
MGITRSVPISEIAQMFLLLLEHPRQSRDSECIKFVYLPEFVGMELAYSPLGMDLILVEIPVIIIH